MYALSLVTAATGFAAEPEDAEARAQRLLESAPLIDGHNDLPWVLRGAANGDVEAVDLVDPQGPDTDIARLRQGGVGAQFWSVYVPSSLGPEEAIRTQLEQIDLARRMIAANPAGFSLALGTADIERARREGRIASLLGIEGAASIGNSLALLRAYYDLGVRYVGLTHLHSTDWADSSTGERRHRGLSGFGVEVIRELNRLGMIVDLAHVSEETVADVLAATRAPVMVSHSGARALTDHARNLSDNALRAIAENGGVVMVSFIPPFVSEEFRLWHEGALPLLMEAETEADWHRINQEYVAEHGAPDRATLSDVADHVEHIARVAGVDHVGIGADFYGARVEHDLVEGLEDVSKYPALIAELTRRGWSDEDLSKLTRENVLRVMREVEARAAEDAN